VGGLDRFGGWTHVVSLLVEAVVNNDVIVSSQDACNNPLPSLVGTPNSILHANNSRGQGVGFGVDKGFSESSITGFLGPLKCWNPLFDAC